MLNRANSAAIAHGRVGITGNDVRSVAREPARLYQAKTAVRAGAAMIWREGGLLDRLERPDLIAAGADDSHDGSDHQHDELARGGESDARQHHQPRAGCQEQAATIAVGAAGHQERVQGVAQQGQGEQGADMSLIEPKLSQIEDQHERQRAVREHAGDAGGE
jgi:hypothetical protein